MSDLPVDTLLSVDQAIAILDSIPIQPRIIRLPIADVLGYRLAEDIFADRDYPPFDKALMDGYAVRSCDAATAGVRLKIIDTIAAGQTSKQPLGPGEAAAIMTGAPLPMGSDAVVAIERASREVYQVILHQPVKVNQSVAREGSDAPAQKLLLAKGTILGPAQIGVAATVGQSLVPVFAKPVVALLATGDELVEIDQIPSGSQIRNSNSHMIRALLQQMGCTVRELGIARDNRDEIRHAIQDGLNSDALFITGGMSMGAHDYVPTLLRELGMDLKIEKLRIKPGKPFVFATSIPSSQSINPSLVFGLPGNPVSAFVCTIRLAGRLINRFTGKHPDAQVQLLKLLNNIPANGPRELYLLAQQVGETVDPIGMTGSADLFSLARANALIVQEEYAKEVLAGGFVKIINLP